MTQPGPSPLALLMVAEMTQLQKEHSDVDPKIVQELYLGYWRRAKPPSIEEAREYVQRVITNVDPDLLRRELGIPDPDQIELATDRTPTRPSRTSEELGASASEALAQLIDADAANSERPFVIVRPNGASPVVAKGQFRAPISGRDLIELERAGVLLSNTRNANGLKTFYLSSDSRQLLDAALAAAGEPTPLSETAASEPGATTIANADEVEAKRADRHGAARGPGRPGWTAELFWTRYQQARGRATPPYTYRAIAPHFETLDGTRGTEPEYVRKLVRRYRGTPE